VGRKKRKRSISILIKREREGKFLNINIPEEREKRGIRKGINSFVGTHRKRKNNSLLQGPENYRLIVEKEEETYT